MANKSLTEAKRNKQDEFYTRLYDVENELRHYKQYFKDKVVFCNCDDPFESNFFKYFALNFNHLGLKKLLATSYDSSPIAYTQLSMFGDGKAIQNINRRAYKIEINEVRDYNDDGAVDLADVEWLLKNKANTLTMLKGDGDFRSQECVDLLQQADIVVTNPPFSLFREYVAQLVEYDKKFLIIGNQNAITYKEIFTFLKKTRVVLFLLFLFIFWQAVQGNLFDGTQMTPNDLPYLDPLQSAYSLLIIGLVFYLGTQGIAKKIRLLPMVKWIATYAYRSYLANVFIFQVVLKLVHPFLTNQPVSLVILVLYMGTFVGSFGLTVVIEHFFKSIFKLGRLVSV